MRTDQFHYDLPPELIAQTPTPRGQSRLLVYTAPTVRLEHRLFPGPDRSIRRPVTHWF